MVRKAVSDYEKEIGEHLFKMPSEVSSSLVIIKP